MLILSRHYQFDRVVGIDIATIGRSKQVPPDFEILDCNLNEKWLFKDAEVDHLVAMMVIEHLFDPFHAFREIKRCLEGNGISIRKSSLGNRNTEQNPSFIWVSA